MDPPDPSRRDEADGEAGTQTQACSVVGGVDKIVKNHRVEC